MRLRTKYFESSQVVLSAGAVVTRDDAAMAGEPIDSLINAWLSRTGHAIVSCTNPTIDRRWLDDERRRQVVTIAAIVVYRENPAVVPEEDR